MNIHRILLTYSVHTVLCLDKSLTRRQPKKRRNKQMSDIVLALFLRLLSFAIGQETRATRSYSSQSEWRWRVFGQSRTKHDLTRTNFPALPDSYTRLLRVLMILWQMETPSSLNSGPNTLRASSSRRAVPPSNVSTLWNSSLLSQTSRHFLKT